VVQYTQYICSLILTIPFLAIAIYLAFDSLSNITVIFIEIVTSFGFLLIAIFLGKVYGNLQKKFMHEKDLRMRSLEEMMRGIKTIKYNSYESFFDERVILI